MNALNSICRWAVMGIVAAAALHWLIDRVPAIGRGLSRCLSYVRRKTAAINVSDSGYARRTAGERVERGEAERGYRLGIWLILYGLVAIRSIGFGGIPGGFNQDGAGPFRQLASGPLSGMGVRADECAAVLSDGTFYLAVGT